MSNLTDSTLSFPALDWPTKCLARNHPGQKEGMWNTIKLFALAYIPSPGKGLGLLRLPTYSWHPLQELDRRGQPVASRRFSCSRSYWLTICKDLERVRNLWTFPLSHAAVSYHPSRSAETDSGIASSTGIRRTLRFFGISSRDHTINKHVLAT